MGKKRKEVKVITITSKKADESDKPKCFGHKEEYCLKCLCGVWFDLCTFKESTKLL